MTTDSASARILVVDDSAVSRQKMMLAVRNLGYAAHAVSGGAEAIAYLEREAVDVVLLDLVMPQTDGFQVLEALGNSQTLRHVPVIVVSTLDTDMPSVVEAIKLGARDFLPKQFESAILNARISAGIESKRNRDAELATLVDVEALSRAATVLETGNFNPDFLGIADVEARADALGRLARVFSGTARQIYLRERRLLQRVNILQGVMLLLAVGASFGAVVPLSHLVSAQITNPIGLAWWLNLVATPVCLLIAWWRGVRIPVDANAMWLIFFLGGLTAVAEWLTFLVVQHVQGAVIALILAAESFIVFGVAAARGFEKPTIKRLAGLVIGMVAVFAIVLVTENFDGQNSMFWLGLTLVIPLLYAVEDMTVAKRMPVDFDPLATTGLLSLVGLILLTPPVLFFDDFVAPSLLIGEAGALIALIALASVIGNVLVIRLLRTSGAVFGSQLGYVLTFSGVLWSMILLGDRLSLLGWVALGVITVGVILVEPAEAEEEIPDLDKVSSDSRS